MSFPKYPGYKTTGLEWPTEAPAHWKQKRLKFVVQLNPSRNEVSDRDRSEEVSFLPMEAVGDDGSLSLEQTRPIAAVETGYTYFRDGDVTIAKITPCFENGKGAVMSGLLGGIGFGTTELIVARPRPGEVGADYLHSVFTCASFRGFGEASMYGAGGQKRVSDDFVRNFRVQMPPLAEQTQIQSFLARETAKIDALVAEQERLIELLDEKRQAVISHAVTKGLDPTTPTIDLGIPWMGSVPIHWRATRIKHLARPGVGGFVDGDWIESPFITTEGVRLLQCGNVGTGVFEEQGFRYVAESTFRQLKCSEVEPGDVLICRLQSSRTILAGRACIAPDLGVRMITSVDNCILKPSAEFDSAYIVYLLSTPEYLGYIEDVARGGTRDRVSRSMLGNVVLAVPPLAEQRQIVDYIRSNTEVTDLLRANSAESIRLLLERRSALISAAVTGQIDVRQLEVA